MDTKKKLKIKKIDALCDLIPKGGREGGTGEK